MIESTCLRGKSLLTANRPAASKEISLLAFSPVLHQKENDLALPLLRGSLADRDCQRCSVIRYQAVDIGSRRCDGNGPTLSSMEREQDHTVLRDRLRKWRLILYGNRTGCRTGQFVEIIVRDAQFLPLDLGKAYGRGRRRRIHTHAGANIIRV